MMYSILQCPIQTGNGYHISCPPWFDICSRFGQCCTEGLEEGHECDQRWRYSNHGECEYVYEDTMGLWIISLLLRGKMLEWSRVIHQLSDPTTPTSSGVVDACTCHLLAWLVGKQITDWDWANNETSRQWVRGFLSWSW